jgi:hypothetical protein
LALLTALTLSEILSLNATILEISRVARRIAGLSKLTATSALSSLLRSSNLWVIKEIADIELN